MTRIRIVKYFFLALISLHALHVDAQYMQHSYDEKPSGIQGVVYGIITIATDMVNNAFDTAEEATDSLSNLLKNTLYFIVNNPITQLTAGFRNRAVGSTMVMLRNAYVEALDPIIETVHQRMEYLSDIREHLNRVEAQLESHAKEIKYRGGRCLNPMLATEITNEMYRCALLPMENTIAQMKTTQTQVNKVFDNLKFKLSERADCLKNPPQQAIICLQGLVTEAPFFVESLNSHFDIPESLHEQQVPINNCLSELKEHIKRLCPNVM